MNPNQRGIYGARDVISAACSEARTRGDAGQAGQRGWGATAVNMMWSTGVLLLCCVSGLVSAAGTDERSGIKRTAKKYKCVSLFFVSHENFQVFEVTCTYK